MSSIFDDEYKFPRKFKYLGFDYLYGYLDSNLDQMLVAKSKSPHTDPQAKEFFTLQFHEILCEKLNGCFS